MRRRTAPRITARIGSIGNVAFNRKTLTVAVLSGFGQQAVALDCPPGQYDHMDVCEDAPAGSYSPGGNPAPTSPILAPAGYFTPVAGRSVPIPADVGRFVRDIGATAATPAPVGRFVATTAATAPIDAPPGRFVAVPGASSASLAPVGRFVPGSGASSATDAPPGRFVGVAGASSATPAPVGRFVPGSGASSATDAPPGRFVGVAGASSATPAPVGRFVPGSGASSATDAPPGRFVGVAGASSATPAPVGRFAAGPGATSATDAPPGRFVAVAGASSATLAPAGRFVPGAGASAATDAPPGRFVPTPGATGAIDAPPGRFVAVAGATMAEDCAGDSTSYGGSVACRLGTDDVPGGVSPVFDTSLGGGGPTALGPTTSGEALRAAFEIMNTSDDLGFADPLTDLTLLGARLGGPDGGLFSLSGFTPGRVLHEGERWLLELVSLAPLDPREYLFSLIVDTDQRAALGEAGESHRFDFSLVVAAGQAVSAPGPAALLAGGLLGVGWLRRRRARDQERVTSA